MKGCLIKDTFDFGTRILHLQKPVSYDFRLQEIVMIDSEIRTGYDK